LDGLLVLYQFGWVTSSVSNGDTERINYLTITNTVVNNISDNDYYQQSPAGKYSQYAI